MRAQACFFPRLLMAVATALLLALVAAPTMAVADTLTLATEVEGEAPGPDPMERDEEGNFGAPTVHEGPRFARFVAAVLSIAAVLGLLSVGYMYVLFVKRPERRQSTKA